MPNFSQSPLDVLVANRNRGYVGLHLEQGVPVLDRDLNLLNDLISATVRDIISRYIGNGIAVGREGFAIEEIPANNDFVIRSGTTGAGTCLVGGIELTITADINYSAQANVPPLTTPDSTQPDPRVDTVYLDVWLREVESNEDSDLLNSADVGMQTSVRQLPVWVVRVAEGIPVPAPAPGHSHYTLAELTRPRNNALIDAGMITDLREPMSPLTAVERRLQILETLLLLPAFAADEFQPDAGTVGQAITLNGRNFDIGNPRVRFGGVQATIVGVPSATGLQATVPAGAPVGGIFIEVETDFGSVTSTAQFVNLGGTSGDPPTLNANEFDPDAGVTGQIITIFGNNFDEPNLQVTFGSTPANMSAATVTPTQIQVPVPAMAAGAVNITVSTDAGSVTSTAQFIHL